MKKQRIWKNTSLRSRLILAFILTSILPIIILNLISYYNISGIVRENGSELTQANLIQNQANLDIWMDSYEDILFQIYTDDDIVDMVQKIDRGDNPAVVKKQLRRTLHGLFYTKEYIRSISVLTENGTLIFYDMLTGSTTQNSWLDNMEISRDELYELVSSDNSTHVISTREASSFNAENHYLFHMGHRIIDYTNLNEQLGIVVVSVDEELLRDICSAEQEENGRKFIVDGNGSMVSCWNEAMLGRKVIDWTADERSRKRRYADSLREWDQFEGRPEDIYLIHDDEFDWDIVYVSNQNEVLDKLNNQQQITVITMILALSTLVMLIVILIRSLTSSLNNMADVMKLAGRGNLAARVEIDAKMPSEVMTIAGQFNHMLEKLENSLEKEKQAGEKQKNAEIAALEAQINPHFLYNTLDTINWMALDRDEFEISNSIGALAAILRYGIDNSNGIVKVKQETEWLKQYLFLQQTRLKNTFSCEIHVDTEAYECWIHKLLLQPFVENSIIHGFDGVTRTHELSIEIRCCSEEMLEFMIYDNGKGMSKEKVAELNQGIFTKTVWKHHIGMENAITRIRMYYGEKAEVRIESEEGCYTRIYLVIPIQSGGRK